MCNGLFPAGEILRLAVECMSVSNLGVQDGSGSLECVGGKFTSALKAAMKGAASRFTSCTSAMLEKPVRMTPPSCSMT